MLNWAQIDLVFLDMDGTLLDLHFDNHFWLSYVPLCYAKKHDITRTQATQHLANLYEKVEGTMQWYCLDYWSNQLGLDIPALKREIEHLIRVHPHVIAFLNQLRQTGKRIVLLTNAHAKSLSLKMDKTQLRGHFDRLITSHDLGSPKEQDDFWQKLQNTESFNPQRTLLVDDSLSVLLSAKRYGIKHIVAVSKPDSKQPAKTVSGFLSIQSFEELKATL